MTLFFSLESLPELASLPTERRRAVLKACQRRVSHASSTLAAGVVVFVFLAGGAVAGFTPPSWPWLAMIAVGTVTAALAATQVRAAKLRPVIREYLESEPNEPIR